MVCWEPVIFVGRFFNIGETLPGSVIFMAYVITFFLMILLRVAVKMVYETLVFDARHSINVFIYGSHGTGVNVTKSLRVSRHNHFRLRGFISDEPDMIGKHTMGCRVYANDERLFDILKKKNVQTVIISSGKEVESEKSELMERLQSYGVHVMLLPSLSECVDDGLIKDIHIEDWLRKEPIRVDLRKIASYIEGRRVMVTGAAGAVGRELIRQLALLNPYQLILVDQAESPLYDVQLELSDHWKNLEVRVQVADVANRTRLEALFRETKPQLVFHAAAYKDVQLMDEFVSEAIQTNIEGTMNVAGLSLKYDVNQCVIVSSDAVTRHSSTLDNCKWLAELGALALARQGGDTKNKCLMIVRFGEVYPHDPCSLMTMAEACQLILEVCSMGENGTTYLLDNELKSTGEPVREKVVRCKEAACDYRQVYEDIIALIRESYRGNQAVLRKRINFFSETSQ
ncbi:MAG: polysaccharide biosynthesis protein [Bacteroides sp.]|nr:polysaccharide biosynthesis protein [Bacteroides sp.]